MNAHHVRRPELELMLYNRARSIAGGDWDEDTPFPSVEMIASPTKGGKRSWRLANLRSLGAEHMKAAAKEFHASWDIVLMDD